MDLVLLGQIQVGEMEGNRLTKYNNHSTVVKSLQRGPIQKGAKKEKKKTLYLHWKVGASAFNKTANVSLCRQKNTIVAEQQQNYACSCPGPVINTGGRNKWIANSWETIRKGNTAGSVDLSSFCLSYQFRWGAVVEEDFLHFFFLITNEQVVSPTECFLYSDPRLLSKSLSLTLLLMIGI